jgi:hypothetical protein
MPRTDRSLLFHIWYPAVFAAVLTIMKLVLPNGAGEPAYIVFLPLCFVLVAQAQVKLLERVKASEPDTMARAGRETA